MADRDGGIVFDDENLTLSDFLNIWLSDCVKDTVRVSTSSATRASQIYTSRPLSEGCG